MVLVAPEDLRKPRPSSTEQDLAVLPLTKVPAEVLPRSLGEFIGALVVALGVDNICAGGSEGSHVLSRLLNVALDIHSVPGGFRDGKTEVESNGTGNAAETDEDTPAVVDVPKAVTIVDDLVLETGDSAESNNTGSH